MFLPDHKADIFRGCPHCFVIFFLLAGDCSTEDKTGFVPGWIIRGGLLQHNIRHGKIRWLFNPDSLDFFFLIIHHFLWKYLTNGFSF